jgi:hypothetical protein
MVGSFSGVVGLSPVLHTCALFLLSLGSLTPVVAPNVSPNVF